jgi:hypothetical protein
MLDDFPWFLEPRRSSSDREMAVGLVLLAAILFFVYPFFDCPCGLREPFRIVGTPTDDRVEFVLASCKACKKSGRLSIFDRCFGEEPLRSESRLEFRAR